MKRFAVEVVSWKTTLTICGAVRRMALLVVEAREVGRLLLAGDAPAGEEVHDDVVAPQRVRATPAPRWSGGAGEGRGGLAHERALHLRSPPGACGWPGRCPPPRGRAGRLRPASGPDVRGDAPVMPGRPGGRSGRRPARASPRARPRPTRRSTRRGVGDQGRRGRDGIGGPAPGARAAGRAGRRPR